MSTPVPTLPTPMPDVEVTASRRKDVPLVVLSRGAAEGPPVFGPGGDGLTEAWIDSVRLTGSAGETQPGPVDSGVRWVVGLGDGESAQWRSAGTALVKAAENALDADTPAAQRGLQVELPADAGGDEVAEFVRGALLGGYRFKVTADEPKPRVREIRLIVPKDRKAEFDAAADRATVLAAATSFARDLANSPSNVKDPAWLARTAAKAAGKVSGLKAEIRDEKWLAKHGFGGVLAVGGGSDRPPRLLELSWAPDGVDGPHVVLVGKGITFDTGGISIKPAEGMHLMRTDMAGGGAVIAAMIAIGKLGLPVRVTGLVPCAENHVSGSAYRPADIVRHYGGKTTEVTNTDAEGRMVLADALAYAVDTLAPDVLVDVATLTGAMKVSLGTRIGGLFADDDALAERVVAAGARVGEAFWRMPLLEEYADKVSSDVADVRQCPPGPGGVTAALFLREFTAEIPWAHLDIAGPARADKPYDDVVPGATGFAARTLVEFVATYSS
ncbi:Cytosol aminopeptidase PepA [Alloactinosynnema sp. L-07]|uniref:leucyl aminopeptidase n=1 Tax=Alloactinosynnema sp. L-07 TaxID=1653480 RepID=UPI00065F06CA|nr:leucyl aminopeptidase [Alloactinosynnema sp. L-07]CRK61708.1 Cytosol aminopeptidase PepA [Alloactinosynnema sp. L-07]